MNQTKKRNIIIGSLLGVLLLMVVGYAAFNSVLNITGTSGISSNWKILITNIETKNIVGGASNAKEPTGIGSLTATFNTNLVSPGDSIEYDITVTNQGSLDARLDKITKTDSNNPAITFTTSGLTEGTILAAGQSQVLTVKVEYNNSVTSQPDNLKSELKVTLDYVQNDGTGGGTVTPGTDNFTGTLYSRNVLTYNSSNYNNESWAKENFIWSDDNIEKIKGYTEDYTTLSGDFFLKHNMVNGQVESSELCFIKDGLHCLKPNEFETSKATLLSVFGESACFVSSTFVGCQDGSLNVTCGDDSLLGNEVFMGDVKAFDDVVVNCNVIAKGYSYCDDTW